MTHLVASSSFADMPDDLLDSITQFLDSRTIFSRVSLVCKSWKSDTLRLKAFGDLINQTNMNVYRLLKICRMPLEEIPELDLTHRLSSVISYEGRIRAEEMRCPIMKFRTGIGSFGLAIHIENRKNSFTQVDGEPRLIEDTSDTIELIGANVTEYPIVIGRAKYFFQPMDLYYYNKHLLQPGHLGGIECLGCVADSRFGNVNYQMIYDLLTDSNKIFKIANNFVPCRNPQFGDISRRVPASQRPQLTNVTVVERRCLDKKTIAISAIGVIFIFSILANLYKLSRLIQHDDL